MITQSLSYPFFSNPTLQFDKVRCRIKIRDILILLQIHNLTSACQFQMYCGILLPNLHEIQVSQEFTWNVFKQELRFRYSHWTNVP